MGWLTGADGLLAWKEPVPFPVISPHQPCPTWDKVFLPTGRQACSQELGRAGLSLSVTKCQQPSLAPFTMVSSVLRSIVLYKIQCAFITIRTTEHEKISIHRRVAFICITQRLSYAQPTSCSLSHSLKPLETPLSEGLPLYIIFSEECQVFETLQDILASLSYRQDNQVILGKTCHSQSIDD